MVHHRIDLRRIAAAEHQHRAVGGRQRGQHVVVAASELDAGVCELDADTGRQDVDHAADRRQARLGQRDRQRGGALHLRDQLVVAAAVEPLLHQHRAREALGQGTQQLPHGVRAADAGHHQHRAVGLRRSLDNAIVVQFHAGNAQFETGQVMLEPMVGDAAFATRLGIAAQGRGHVIVGGHQCERLLAAATERMSRRGVGFVCRGRRGIQTRGGGEIAIEHQIEALIPRCRAGLCVRLVQRQIAPRDGTILIDAEGVESGRGGRRGRHFRHDGSETAIVGNICAWVQ